MKYKILSILALTIALGQSFCIQAETSDSSLEAAKSFIQDLGARAVTSLTTPGIAQNDLESKFQALLEEGFDVPLIAKFVMGSNWNSLSSDQQQRFIPLFEKRLKKTYASRFQQYQGVKFTVKTARKQNDSIIVHTTIQKPGGVVTPVDWEVQNGKIHDVKIEGISMTITIRDEYKEIFKKGQEEQFLSTLTGSEVLNNN